MVVENVRYHYGFEATDGAFTAEWLYSFPRERRQMLFERDNATFVFGRHLKGRNQVISELTRPNSLFLSAAAQNGHDELTRIFLFFQAIQLDTGAPSQPAALAVKLRRKEADERIIRYLEMSGTGITGYRVDEASLDRLLSNYDTSIEVYPDGTSTLTQNNAEDRTLKLAHRGTAIEPVYLEFDQESMGTRRLLGLLVPIFQALDTGTPILVDELDSSLHTQACELLLSLFGSPVTNPKGAQLIATTHDTNLLYSKHLRRDQVWFTEKGQEGATHLYPLTEFRTRKSDNLARGYLQGRYGATPFAGRAADLTSGL